MRPAALPGSRISETRETTDGSAELKFRIQFPPAGESANFRFLAGCGRLQDNPFCVNVNRNFALTLDVCNPNNNHAPVSSCLARSCSSS